MSKLKPVLICERTGSYLKLSKEDSQNAESNNYIFEGEFATLNEMNRNDRYYKPEEYLPQVENLIQEVKNGNVLGEIDHPKRFDTKLREASHRILDIYDVKENGKHLIKGKIQLLSTAAGKDARALADDGVQLNISSRAAGVVESDGNVKIKKLFTYDLVNKPGFKSAKLNRVNEEYGIDDSNIDVYELNEDMMEDPKFKLLMENDSEFANAVSENFDNNNFINNINESKNKEKDTMSTPNENQIEERFNKYSEYVSEEIKSLQEQLSSVKESIDNSDDGMIQRLIEHNNYLAEKIENVINFTDYIAENVDSNPSNSDNDSIVEYLDYVADIMNSNMDEVNESQEKLDNAIQYSEYIAENTENLIQYSDYVAENVENTQEYTNYIAENLDNSIEFSEYIAENTENSIEHNDYIVEELNNNGVGVSPNADAYGFKHISEGIDKLISSSKNNEEAGQEQMPQFLNLVGDNYEEAWKSYDSSVKESLIEAFEDKEITRTSEAKHVWENTISDFFDVQKMIPEHLEPEWNALRESRKQEILEQAKSYNFISEDAITNFWETRDLTNESVLQNRKRAKVQKMQQINEDRDYSDLIERVKKLS